MAKNNRKTNFSDGNLALNPPDYIVNARIMGSPIKYKWNSDIGLKFYAAVDHNIRLFDTIDASNFKAKMALGIAITEWIIWRLKGHTDLSDALLRIEAAWASSVNTQYTRDLSLKMIEDDNIAPVEGPLELALCNLGKINGRYVNGNIFLAAPIVNQSMLARHLMPDKKVYNDWLLATIDQMVQMFPRGAKYDRFVGTYDFSNEKPVSRKFFDSPFHYTTDSAELAIEEFLKSLDPKKNPYLRFREEIIADGFKGEPYKL